MTSSGHPPRPLSEGELDRRIARLRAEGKPITLRNVDPDYAAYWDRRVRESRRNLIFAYVAAIVGLLIFAVFIATVILGGGR
jgi:hypothetical protein